MCTQHTGTRVKVFRLASEFHEGILVFMGDIVLRPVKLGEHWRVEMAWRGRKPRYFGKFETQAEAEKWIEEHRSTAAYQRQPKPELQNQN